MILGEVIGAQEKALASLSIMINEHKNDTVAMSQRFMSDANAAGTLLLIITAISALLGALIAWGSPVRLGAVGRRTGLRGAYCPADSGRPTVYVGRSARWR